MSKATNGTARITTTNPTIQGIHFRLFPIRVIGFHRALHRALHLA